jgi:succinate dehydrogenase/fumarate reductase cytochrome b subunit
VSPSAPYSTIAAAKPSYLLHIVLAGVALALLGALIVGVWMLVSSP